MMKTRNDILTLSQSLPDNLALPASSSDPCTWTASAASPSCVVQTQQGSRSSKNLYFFGNGFLNFMGRINCEREDCL